MQNEVGVRIIVRDTPTDIAQLVADRIVDRAATRGLAVLGVATGSSPSAVYRALAAADSDAIRGLEAFALDEYVGLAYSSKASYHAVVEMQIRAPLGLDPAKGLSSRVCSPGARPCPGRRSVRPRRLTSVMGVGCGARSRWLFAVGRGGGGRGR
jgi:hypothetical protein